LIVTGALLGGCDAFATPIADDRRPGSGGVGGFGGFDAGRDAGGFDAGRDTGVDASEDAGPDASDDAGADDGDASVCRPGECGCDFKCSPS